MVTGSDEQAGPRKMACRNTTRHAQSQACHLFGLVSPAFASDSILRLDGLCRQTANPPLQIFLPREPRNRSVKCRTKAQPILRASLATRNAYAADLTAPHTCWQNYRFELFATPSLSRRLWESLSSDSGISSNSHTKPGRNSETEEKRRRGKRQASASEGLVGTQAVESHVVSWCLDGTFRGSTDFSGRLTRWEGEGGGERVGGFACGIVVAQLDEVPLPERNYLKHQRSVGCAVCVLFLMLVPLFLRLQACRFYGSQR
ncbi:hypothetical protein N658DRAFT_297779 [Parathielavia hyrcaniae]|uniref:Uncharacterized protein n=1 Tax=Parathielavia hyrcaniae TaxID=113614 RepID=A0AAN6T3T9_9PEZI|nr:hypothetical protein N658DRAFT_297779 [Parathielavia hyrcaniae]